MARGTPRCLAVPAQRHGRDGSAGVPWRTGRLTRPAPEMLASRTRSCIATSGRRQNESMARWRESNEMLLFVFSTALLLAGGAAWLLAAETPASVLWIAGTVLGLVFSVSWTAGAIRRHQPSVDVIAVLALAGALAVDEPFAGAMIAVMLASGQLLEARAAARARRELSLLVQRAPRKARLRVPSGVLEVEVDDVEIGAHVVVGPGEVVPVDGRLLADAVLDES